MMTNGTSVEVVVRRGEVENRMRGLPKRVQRCPLGQTTRHASSSTTNTIDNCSTNNLSVMAGGVALTEGVRAIVIHMRETCFLDAKSIAYLTGIPIRTVYHVLSIWRKTGEVKPAPEGKQGRPRALDFGDTRVSLFFASISH